MQQKVSFTGTVTSGIKIRMAFGAPGGFHAEDDVGWYQ
jgi:hypothetical protein